MFDQDPGTPDQDSAAESKARAEKAVADAIEETIDKPGSIEEEEMLEAAEITEVEFPED